MNQQFLTLPESPNNEFEIDSFKIDISPIPKRTYPNRLDMYPSSKPRLSFQEFPSDHFSQIETQEDTLLRSTKAKFTKPPDYEMLLMREKNSDKLIEKFEDEKNFLRRSDALGFEFDINSCIERLKKGYTLIWFDYNHFLWRKIKFTANKEGILLLRKKRKNIKIPFNTLLGILIGDESSTFEEYKAKIGSIDCLGLDCTDCFSLISSLKNYDFATPSDRAKYDIYLVSAWHINISSNMSSTIPLTKQAFTKLIVRKKLYKMAEERKLWIHELFFLAIRKVLGHLKARPEALGLIKKKLDYMVHTDSKIHRICFKIKPKHWRPSHIFCDKEWDEKRLIYMQRRMADLVKRVDHRKIELLREWNRIKNDFQKVLALPGLKESLKPKSKPSSPEKSNLIITSFENKSSLKKIFTKMETKLSINIYKEHSVPSGPIPSSLNPLQRFLTEISFDIDDWKDSFIFLDKHNRGFVTPEELSMIIQRHNASLNLYSTLQETYGRPEFRYTQFLLDAKQQQRPLSTRDLQRLRQKIQQELNSRAISPTMLFLRFDSNGNGWVSPEEIVEYFKSLNLTVELKDMCELVKVFSKNPKGLNYPEFSEMFFGKELKETDDLMNKLATVLLSKEFDLLTMLTNFDVDGSGQIDKQSFVSAVNSLIAIMNDVETEKLFEILCRNSGELEYRKIGFLVYEESEESSKEDCREVLDTFIEEFFNENEKVRRYLSRVDSDNDGALVSNEWKQALEMMGVMLEEGQIKEVFASVEVRGVFEIESFVQALRENVWERN